MNSSYERSGLRHRLKDFSILGFASLVIALISTLVMDLLIYPLSTFALNKTVLFTRIFQYGFLALVIGVFIFMIIKKFHTHKKNGLTKKATLIDIAKAPALALSSAFFLLIISAAIIVVIYLLLSYNNNFINSLINN